MDSTQSPTGIRAICSRSTFSVGSIHPSVVAGWLLWTYWLVGLARRPASWEVLHVAAANPLDGTVGSPCHWLLGLGMGNAELLSTTGGWPVCMGMGLGCSGLVLACFHPTILGAGNFLLELLLLFFSIIFAFPYKPSLSIRTELSCISRNLATGD